jgi:hypothetical protein
MSYCVYLVWTSFKHKIYWSTHVLSTCTYMFEAMYSNTCNALPAKYLIDGNPHLDHNFYDFFIGL